MSKKNYMAPAAKVIIMKSAAIMNASRVAGGGDASDIGWGGKASNYSGEAGSRSGGFWDDEE